MILDVTAGNRHIWGENKYPEGVIFMDKEPNLRIPADIIATWDKIPYPDNYFDCVLFDPPYHYGNSLIQFQNPREDDPRKSSWYGYPFKTKREMVCEIYKAQKEIARVSSRLCFKWMDLDLSVDRILSVFDCWEVQFKQSFNGRRKTDSAKRYWVKMVRKSSSVFVVKSEA